MRPCSVTGPPTCPSAAPVHPLHVAPLELTPDRGWHLEPHCHSSLSPARAGGGRFTPVLPQGASLPVHFRHSQRHSRLAIDTEPNGHLHVHAPCPPPAVPEGQVGVSSGLQGCSPPALGAPPGGRERPGLCLLLPPGWRLASGFYGSQVHAEWSSLPGSYRTPRPCAISS